MAIKYAINLSTTEPNNSIGTLKIRQADEQTQTLVVQITENGVPRSYEGLQVFFCAKLGQSAGLGIIEQKLNADEMTNPQNGQLEYTFRDEDWQQIGRQTGYFSFRKMANDHTFVEQFSTRDFYFNVMKNVFSDGISEVKKDGSTYVWTFEDLLRLFKEFMESGRNDFDAWYEEVKNIFYEFLGNSSEDFDQWYEEIRNLFQEYMETGRKDWEEFVEQNREVLESVDPGGKLIGELIDARRPFGGDTYPTLGERLDREKAEFTAQLAHTITDVEGRGVNAKKMGLKGDGLTNDADALITMITLLNSSNNLVLPPGKYLINNDVTIPSTLSTVFTKGAVIKVGIGATLTFEGDIIAGNYEIFEDGGGRIDKSKSASAYNLSWYKGDSINKRFDFAKRDFSEFRSKTIVIPKPYLNQPGTNNMGDGRVYWTVDGQLLIDDKSNASDFHFYGEFKAVANFDSFLKIQGPNKPENVYFYGTFQFNVPPEITVKHGINICDGARINFYDQIIINGAEQPLKIGGAEQTQPCEVFINQAQLSFFNEKALIVDGSVAFGATSFNINNLDISSAESAGLDAVEIRGLIRNSRVEKVRYIKGEAKNGYLANGIENLVNVKSYGDYFVIGVEFGRLSATEANTILKISSESLSNGAVQDIKVGSISQKSNGKAFVLDYCKNITIEKIENAGSGVTQSIGTNAQYANIMDDGGTAINDSGLYTTIGGIGRQTRGGGVRPSAAVQWRIGTIVMETSDSKLYLRVAKTGVDATDFVALN